MNEMGQQLKPAFQGPPAKSQPQSKHAREAALFIWNPAYVISHMPLHLHARLQTIPLHPPIV